MAKAYNLEALAKRALAAAQNNGLKKLSALQIAGILEISQITAYKVLYYLQINGYLDKDCQVIEQSVKEALAK